MRKLHSADAVPRSRALRPRVWRGRGADTDPAVNLDFWSSRGSAHIWNFNQDSPATDWEKRIDEIFYQAVQEFDPAKRKALYREWIDIVSKEQPVIYLTTNERVAALRDKFGNVMPSPWPEYGKPLLQYEEYLFVK